MTVSETNFSANQSKQHRVLVRTGVAAVAVCLTTALGYVNYEQANKQQQLAYQEIETLRGQEKYDQCATEAESFSRTHYSYLGLSFDNPTIQNQVQVLVSACQQDKIQQIALKKIQTLKTDGKYIEAITTAKAFSDSQSRYYAEAKTLLDESRLAQAQLSAENSKFLDAITWVKEISSGTAVYGKSQRLVGQWSDKILEVATGLYQEGKSSDFPKALQIARAIPKDGSVYEKAQASIKQWQKDEAQDKRNFERANTALNTEQWDSALAAANQLQNSPAKAWREAAQRLTDQANQGKEKEAEPLNIPHGTLDDSSSRLISDSSRYQEHRFEGREGKTVTITMESSDFETYLIVHAPNGQEFTSDRSQISHKSTITIPSCTTGTYRILANARYLQGQGQYSLKVRTMS